MKQLAALLVIAVAATPTAAHASWFEYCDIGGEVQEAELTGSKRTYEITVAVTTSARAKLYGDESYTDCTEHLDKTMQVTLRLPRRAGVPATGDHILFYRSAADCFGPGGEFVGQCVSNRFLQLRKPQLSRDES